MSKARITTSSLTICAGVALSFSICAAPAPASPQLVSAPASQTSIATVESSNSSHPLPSHTIGDTTSTVTTTSSPVTPSSSATGTDSSEVVYEQDEDSKLIAQAAATSTTSNATDLAPVKLPERTNALTNFDSYRTNILYKLPSRMFLNGSVENSIRLETNVFQTLKNHRSDLVYRCLPNVTIGYAVTKRTRAAFNYFYIRDQYAVNNNALSRNIHSIGFRVDQDFPISPRTTVTSSLFMRELLLSRTQSLSDILPSVTVVRRVGERGILYGSVLGQIRFRRVLGGFQEGDQFYGFGGIYRTARWQFLADHTFITNFGKRHLRFGPDNCLWVLTYEAARRIHPMIPASLFVRAEPIFNIGANQATGFAGFNMRLFGGIRVEVNKPPIFPVKLGKPK